MDDLEVAGIVAEAAGASPAGATVTPLGGRQGLLVCRVELPGCKASYVFKAVRQPARRELQVAALVSEIAPDCVPRVIVSEADTKRDLYWLVSEDAGTVTLADRPSPQGYAEAARTLARLQIAALGLIDRFGELGVRVVGVRDWEEIGLRVLEQVGAWSSLPNLIDCEDLERLVWSVDDLVRDASVAPESVIHGDLHAGNLALIRTDPPSIRLMDWGTAYVGPAFLGLEEILWPGSRHLRSRGEVQQVRTAYLREWGDLLGKAGHLERPLLACRALVRIHVFSQTLRESAETGPNELFQPAAVFRKLLEAFKEWQRLV